MHPINKPQVTIGAAQTKFDEGGDLIDEPTRDVLCSALSALRDWTLMLGSDVDTSTPRRE
jgi:chromate reductase